MLPGFAYVRPLTLPEVAVHAAKQGARVHAGGTDLLGCLRDGIFTADTLVSLSRVSELQGITALPDGGLRIGALTSIAEIAGHATIRERYTALAQAAEAVASPQLRNQGTLGGNLCQKPRCWYYRRDFRCLRKGGDTCYAYNGENQVHCIFGGQMCYAVHPSDTAPALSALGATVKLAGPAGTRQVPLKEFFVPVDIDPTRETVLKAGEILTEVTLPGTPVGLRSSYRKIRTRRSWDFALVGVALALVMQGDVVRQARVVLSGVAMVPWNADKVEAVLAGKRLDDSAMEKAADAAVAGAEPLSENAYKLPMLRGLIRQQLEALLLKT